MQSFFPFHVKKFVGPVKFSARPVDPRCHWAYGGMGLVTFLISIEATLGVFATNNQGWVSSGRNLFLPGRRKKPTFFHIFTVSSGRNGRIIEL